LHFLLAARLVDRFALVVLAVDAVDQHADGNALDAAALDHLGLGGAGDFVIDDLFRLLALIARRVARLSRLRGAGQLVADADLALAALAGGAFLARLTRAHDAAFWIEAVGRLRDAVEVELAGELDAGAARPHHRGDDRFHLVAQAPFERDLTLVGAGPAATLDRVAVR